MKFASSTGATELVRFQGTPARATPRAGSGNPPERGPGQGLSRDVARKGFSRFQTLIGFVLLLSSATGAYLLASDKSLWLLAVSHAVGLVMIVVIDAALGLLSLSSRRGVYIPSEAAALLGFILQLGDILTAPQCNMTVQYFATYLFGLYAFDLLLALQASVLVIALLGRRYARYLARRKTRRGQELDYSRRGFLKAVVGFGTLIGLGVLLGSLKLPAPAAPAVTNNTTTRTGVPPGAIANVGSLQVDSPVYFEYPAGYPNLLLKNSDGSLVALSTLCTHVCCECQYESSSKVLRCPCHGSVFDATGQVLQGPSDASLPTVELKVDGSGNVFPTGVSNPGPCNA